MFEVYMTAAALLALAGLFLLGIDSLNNNKENHYG